MKENGYFGEYGGCYVPDSLKKELNNIYEGYLNLKKDKKFKEELSILRKTYQGRPTPLYFCRKLTDQINGANIYLKREDLNHTGAHKINHCLGEVLLAKYLGKSLIIGETGAGQHGLALATACALIGIKCKIFMGEIDVNKQFINVQKMQLLGAEVVCVKTGGKSLKDAVDEALKYYEKTFNFAMYCIGSVVGPHPFPTMVREFQSVVGKEAKRQFKKLLNTMPDAIVACVGGGSNAIGIFNAFIKDTNVNLYGVEPLGKGEELGKNAASITYGKVDILHGFKSLVLEDEKGKVVDAYSIASGLDYPSVGPQHAYLNQIKRVKYVTCDDEGALDGFYTLTKVEGIIPALESAHAVSFGMILAKELGKGKNILINLSGRGDKDVDFVLNLKNNVINKC